MIQLVGHHHDLAPMVGLMGDEVGQDVADIEGQVAPHIGPRGRDLTALPASQPQEVRDASATADQSRDELPAGHGTVIHSCWGGDSVLAAERLDPAASGVVEVSSNRPDGAARDSRNPCGPQGRRRVLDQMLRDPAVDLPRSCKRDMMIDLHTVGRCCRQPPNESRISCVVRPRSRQTPSLSGGRRATTASCEG